MNRELIEEIIATPYVKKEFHYEKNGLFFECYFIYKESGELIEGEIRCSNDPNMRVFGSVDVSINLERLKNENRAGFGELFVNGEIQNNGIGKALMLSALDEIKSFKEYCGVDSDVRVSGWLSQADSARNWAVSVPMYEKVGKIAGIRTAFLIQDTQKEVAPAEEFFRNVGDSDGTIVYFV